MRIHSVEADMFHAVKQTDKHNEANGRLSQFCDCA